MRDRPFLVTIICAYLIIAGSLILTFSFKNLSDPAVQEKMRQAPFPVNVLVVKLYLSGIIPILTGIFMFEGENWARYVYAGWGVLNHGMDTILLPQPEGYLYLGLFLVLTVVLFLPRQTEYFCLPQHFT